MTTEEQAAKAIADAAAAKAAADAGAGSDTVSRSELLKVIAQRDKLKADRDADAAILEAGRKALDANKSAEERMAALIVERDALKGTAEKATAAMTARLAVEIAAIPETMRGLVPAGLDPADQLAWIASASAAGVFGQRTASPGAQLHGGQGGATVTQTYVANLPPGTKRDALMHQIREGKVTVVSG